MACAEIRKLRCPEPLRPALRQMLHELDFACLQVTLVPAPEQRHAGHYVRLVVGHNPGWYRELCSMFPRGRRPRRNLERYPDSRIKRGDIRAVIERLLDNRGTASGFAPHLLSFAREETQAAARRIEREVAAELECVFGAAPAMPRAVGCEW
ncbi:MAG: hypothetical protein HY916_09305 [Desulfovibrio sp.]|jgi:hypothetical protein|nr:hypothetical protein [Desulfovibrio sp.]